MLVGHFDDTSTDQVTRLLASLFQTLVSNSPDFHFHWSSWKFQLHMQLAIGARKVMFADAYRRNDQRETSATDVKGMPVKRRQTAEAIAVNP